MAARAIPLNSTNVRKTAQQAFLRLRLAVAARFAPRRAAELAAQLFATPPRHAHTDGEKALLETATGFVVPSVGRRIAAWRLGALDRPVVVVSHGWGGRGAQFRHFVPALRDAGFAVVLFDYAAHGLSEGGEATLVHFLQDLDAVVGEVERQGGVVAGLVGHSLGAAAVGAWLNLNGRKLRAVLLAPPTSVIRYSNFFARRLGLAEPLRRAMQEGFERRLGRRWSEFELPHSVARVEADALVIHDQDDEDVAFASGLALARAWHRARFVATRGLGHRGVLRDAAVVRDAVDFLAARVAFAPPPAPGAASFGAPAPIL